MLHAPVESMSHVHIKYTQSRHITTTTQAVLKLLKKTPIIIRCQKSEWNFPFNRCWLHFNCCWFFYGVCNIQRGIIQSMRVHCSNWQRSQAKATINFRLCEFLNCNWRWHEIRIQVEWVASARHHMDPMLLWCTWLDRSGMCTNCQLQDRQN